LNDKEIICVVVMGCECECISQDKPYEQKHCSLFLLMIFSIQWKR